MTKIVKSLLFAALFSVLIFAIPAHAQTISAASCSSTDVQAALNKISVDGTTVVIPSCASTVWSTQVSYSQTKSFTLQGQTTCTGTPATSCADRTIIYHGVTGNTAALLISTMAGKTFRLTGITFTGGNINSNGGGVQIYGNSTAVRIDHVHFLNLQATAILTGGIFGVMDHDVFDISNNQEGWRPQQAGTGDGSWAAPTGLGGPNFMFLEDSTVNGTGQQGGTTNDCFTGGKYVVRHNILNNSSVQGHTTGHASDDRGCRAQEFYLNTLPAPSGGIIAFNGIDLESGTGIVFGNTVSQYSNFTTLHDKRASTATYHQTAPPDGWGYCGSAQTGVLSAWDQNTDSTGYACIDQVGRGQGDLLRGLFPNKCNSALNPACNVFTGQWPRQAYEPIYEWNDKWSCSNCGGNFAAFYDTVVQNNRDIFLSADPHTGAQLPFDGTIGPGKAGTGFGLLANRPSSCTQYVGYFATDVGGQGTLYQCSSTNTWTVYYTPYTYPHPLTQGSGSGSNVAAPTNLSAVVQ